MIELERDRLCDYRQIVEGQIVECPHLSEYRVLSFSKREIMNEDGEFESETEERYMCREHFDSKWRYVDSSLLPESWMFRKIKRRRETSLVQSEIMSASQFVIDSTSR